MTTPAAESLQSAGVQEAVKHESGVQVAGIPSVGFVWTVAGNWGQVLLTPPETSIAPLNEGRKCFI